MNLKLRNTKGAAFVLAVMMVGSGSASAGTATLSGAPGNSCASYTGFSADANGNLTITCTGEPAPPPSVAPSCTLTASPSTINSGSSSTLIANCSPAATSYAWTNSGFGSTVASGNVSPTSATTYSVVGTNDVGAGNVASITVNVSTTAPITSGGGTTPGTRTVPPTSADPVSVVKEWNYAFETVNFMPHNAKVEPYGTMAYYKVIQAGKPTQIHLPNPW